MMMLEREAPASDRYGTFEGKDDAEDEIQVANLHNGHRQQARRWTRGGRVSLVIVALLFAVLGCVAWSAHRHQRAAHRGATTDSPSSSSSVDSPTEQTVRVYLNEKGDIQTEFGSSGIDETAATATDAWGTFNDSLESVGWSQLWIKTANLTKDEYADKRIGRQRRQQIMFAAGYAEGTLTHHRIDQHFHNVYFTFFPQNDKADLETVHALHRFFSENLDWMHTQIRHHEQYETLPDCEYWEAMSYILAQFDGLVAGYHNATKAETPASALDLFMLNADGDLEDLVVVAKRSTGQAGLTVQAAATTDFYTFIKNLKCSALIRILPGFSDLIWGHDTWDSFASMNRIFKHYDVPLAGGRDHTSAVKRKISMSSSPGFLSSVDDWYMTSAGLGVMETTHGIFNPELYDLVTPQSVPCWLRSKIANYLATDGPSWATTFAKHNSGTYNNQWMVVDTNKFAKGHGFEPHGLTVLEQLPGFIQVEDVSSVVNTQGYWASYNVPYFEEIYTRSGFASVYKATNQTASWSHEQCARAKIFKRDAPTIASFEDFKRVMRSNNWETDPLSERHASHAIASRYDLETEPQMFSLDGAIDAKVTTLDMIQRLECDAVAGPTYANNPVFEWTPENEALAPHDGHPQRFDFIFTTMKH